MNQLRDCGSDFPWDLDVGDMFKVGTRLNIFHYHITVDITITVDFTLTLPRSGTITRTRTSSPTETRALLPSSQVKTENLNFGKFNLEMIVKAYKTDNTLSLVPQGPNRQSTTPTSCTPLTTPSTRSCIKPRSEN